MANEERLIQCMTKQSSLFKETSLDEKIVEARAILSAAVKEHQPREIFALFSGGYDSLVVAHLLSQFASSVGIAHFNTGIGIEETREYARQTCKSRDWPLVEKVTPESYEDLVLERGFPGPAHHWKMYCRLKDRSVEALVREYKQGRVDRIMLVTGIRRQESRKRMGYKDAVNRRGAQVWVNPLLNWSKFHIHAYKARYDLPDNRVVEVLHMSGECLCGAYAHKGELAEIKLWFPETGSYIESLERKVRAAGHNWGWEEPPPLVRIDKHPDQRGLFDMPLCTNCEAKAGIVFT
jgi:3'-phosphoadenosine 5'-phosphosulfate sulfotransferase (PAPS reductase)/FAD synthetase